MFSLCVRGSVILSQCHSCWVTKLGLTLKVIVVGLRISVARHPPQALILPWPRPLLLPDFLTSADVADAHVVEGDDLLLDGGEVVPGEGVEDASVAALVLDGEQVL